MINIINNLSNKIIIYLNKTTDIFLNYNYKKHIN